ncbi:hypothetical protein OS493_028787 [Desmophyllum pertusum]|uniref:Uncharacterized protein n=1 Tax=Desmophyllum pertusum TaxID=174260 RepID=A0A9X0D8S7_9CNID|nr:hypothetical protein OS493_028787 [Desmophyllum pertusum]
MELEVQKTDLMTALKESKKKLSCVEQTNLVLEEEQSRRIDLESTNSDLKTMQENSNRRVGELMMILEQERAQTSQVEKNKEKLVIERKQYLDNMTADRQIIEKLQNDLKAKEDEISTVKEKLMQIEEGNSLLKRNMEEESERLTKKVRDTYLDLKSKDQKLETAREEIANYRCKIEEVEIAKQEILTDASHEAELLGSTIDKLQADLNQKQELMYQLEHELEDVNTQLAQEKGKTTALEEDYESVIRALHDQLEGEKALNESLCTQSDRNVASLQGQVQKQLDVNMERSQQLEEKMLK